MSNKVSFKEHHSFNNSCPSISYVWSRTYVLWANHCGRWWFSEVNIDPGVRFSRLLMSPSNIWRALPESLNTRGKRRPPSGHEWFRRAATLKQSSHSHHSSSGQSCIDSDEFFALPMSMLGYGFNESPGKVICCSLTGNHTFVGDDSGTTAAGIG